MVVDASVLLAIFFNEVHSAWAIAQMNNYPNELRMSTVNLAEVLIHLHDRQPHFFEKFEDELLYTGRIRFVEPNVEQAKTVAKTRLKFLPLNLGDCFAYALAVQEGCPILTLDKDFLVLPHTIIAPGLESKK